MTVPFRQRLLKNLALFFDYALFNPNGHPEIFQFSLISNRQLISRDTVADWDAVIRNLRRNHQARDDMSEAIHLASDDLRSWNYCDFRRRAGLSPGFAAFPLFGTTVAAIPSGVPDVGGAG